MFRRMLLLPLILCGPLFAQSPVITPKPKALGNVFTEGEAVEIPVATRSPKLKYTITNLWREPVATGEVQTADGVATILPDGKTPGYFEVELFDPEKPLEKAKTSYAILTPVDLAKMPNNPFGVMTHFAQYMSPEILPLIAKAGIGTIRDEAYWNAVEKKPGEYATNEKFDTYMSEAKKHNIDVIMVMSFENKLYDNGDTPFTPKARQAYADYGAFLLKHYGEQIKTLEVWNEYNGTWCKGPAAKDRPTSYAGMIKPVYETVKARRPDVKVLGGAAVLLPPPYFEGIFKAGGLNSMDAVVIHPYRGQPEGVEVEVAALQEMIRKYNGGKDKPIWVTETGRMDPSPDGRHNIASYLVRQYTLLLSVNCEKICWYLSRDYMNFKTMGLLRDPKDLMGAYTPAPAYVAYSTLIRELYGRKFVKREASDPRTRVYSFANGKEETRVCWATVPTHIAMEASGPVTVTDMTGGAVQVWPRNGQVIFTLDADPVFVKAEGAALGKIVPASGLMLLAEQTIDVLAPQTVRFSVGNSSDAMFDGFFSIADTNVPVRVGPRAKAEFSATPLQGDTFTVGDRVVRYTLRDGDKAVARGTVHTVVADPLVVTSAALTSPGVLELRVANRSSITSYAMSEIAYKLGDQSERKPLPVTLGAGEIVFTIPVDKVAPYKELPFELTLTIKSRGPLTYRTMLAYNPVTQKTIGEASDWKGVPPIELSVPAGWKSPKAGESPRAFLAADKEKLYISAIVPGDAITFAVAGAKWSATDPRAGYYEFSFGEQGTTCTIAPVDSPKVDVEASAERQGGITTYRAAIPWKSLKGTSPEDGSFRFAMAVTDVPTVSKPSGPLTFAGGIVRGKSPAEMAICRLGAAAEAPAGIEVRPEKYETPEAALKSIGVLADSDEEYTNEQGARGWTYGYFPGEAKATGGTPEKGPVGPYTDSDFRAMEFVQTVWGYEWAAPAIRNLKLTRNGGHPGAAGGRQAWAVRRWTSPVEGMIRITGTLNRGDSKGDGTEARILVGGVVVYSRLLTGKEAVPFEVTVRVKKGELIDFALTPGAAGDTSYDAATFEVRVTEVGR